MDCCLFVFPQCNDFGASSAQNRRASAKIISFDYLALQSFESINAIPNRSVRNTQMLTGLVIIAEGNISDQCIKQLFVRDSIVWRRSNFEIIPASNGFKETTAAQFNSHTFSPYELSRIRAAIASYRFIHNSPSFAS